ncbi:MAG: DegT/DnrJ/EryC1/StrS family aminotransferase [bacterium]
MTKMKIPYSRVTCNGNEMAYLREVLESGWLTTASKAFDFEKRFGEAVRAKHACAVNSCTSALHLALEAVGIGEGSKVFVPSMTFTASAEVVRYLNADPVFLDVEYGTSLITPEILSEAVARYPEVKTAVVVHYGGQAAHMTIDGREGILDICKKNGIRVIEDAAHAFPSRLDGRMVGSFGDATCFSFYANKTITTAEGGMLVTNDDQVAARAKVMRLHGIDRDIWSRFTADKPSWEYDIVAPGYKYNISDVAAAIGLAQLERAEDMRKERERCARFYMKNLDGVAGLDLPNLHVGFGDHAWHLFSIIIKPDVPISRNRCIENLAECGIGTSVHYKPLYRMTYYRKAYNLKPEDFPNAERIWNGCISLPIYPSLKNEELEYICQTLIDILKY